MKKVSSRKTLAFLALTVASGCGLENSLVGGQCLAGMVLSGNQCVPAGGITLVTPTDPPPAPVVVGAVVAPPRSDTFIDDVPVIGPTKPVPAELHPEEPVLQIVDPPLPVLHCVAPLVLCHGACIPVDSDPANCGACGKICPSNICVAGECQGATPGDVVLIGHDYTDANMGSAQTKVLVNALTIPTTDPIRVLSFEDGASAPAVARMKALASGSIKNRQVRFTRASDAGALTSSTLASVYDIVIINDASAVDPATQGTSWAGPLGTFTTKGGVVIALDRGTSSMPELLTSAGLLTVSGHTSLPEGSHLVVSAAADVIGAQVLSPYAGFGAPVSFQGLPPQSADLTWVVRRKLSGNLPGDAVVVHRVVR